MDSTLYSDMQAKKISYMNQVYKYFNGEINGLLWQLNKFDDLPDLLALGADYNGFMEDPITKYQINKVLAADSEWLFNLLEMLESNLVLDLLEREIKNLWNSTVKRVLKQ